MEPLTEERRLEENLESMKRLLDQPFYRFSAPADSSAAEPQVPLGANAQAPGLGPQPAPAVEEQLEAPILEIRRAPELIEEPPKQKFSGMPAAILAGVLVVLLLALRFWFSAQPKLYKASFSDPAALGRK